MSDWCVAETNTHQDHVIAHVVGATIEGHFVWDETGYLLLDIGFVWNVYLDGEMGLVPHPVAINEMGIDEVVKTQLRGDVDALLQGADNTTLQKMTLSPVRSPIQSIDFSVRENSRRLVVTCEEGMLVVETSLETAEVKIMKSENENGELSEAVLEEQKYVRERLKVELEREPTNEEVDEWLREHTESY